MFDFITNILNIDKSRIKSFHVATVNGVTNIFITLNPDYPECLYCHGSSRIHGYSKPKKINHPVLTARKSIIVYTATRYRCRDCQKTFLEDNPFTFSTFKNFYFAMDQIMKDLRNIRMSYLDIARKNNVSVSTVQRYMDSFLVIPRQTLPVNLGIDEIHTRLAHYGNSKYLCILTDNENLSLVYHLKERYLDFNKNATSSNCEEWFDTLYNAFVEANIPEYREFTVLLYNWREEILHSFARPFQTVSSRMHLPRISTDRFGRIWPYPMESSISYGLEKGCSIV